MHRVVILGAGFGGLELATRLSEDLADSVSVTLIDKNDAFVFGFSKLDVMFGRQPLDAVRLRYSHFEKRGVDFRQETVTTIDPSAKRVTTDRESYAADTLVVALGADLAPEATPGLIECGNEFYSVSGAAQLRDILAGFHSGRVVVAVLGSFFKCPAAPYETVLMLDDMLAQRGDRQAVTISITTTLGSPIPISPEASGAILDACRDRGIDFWPQAFVERLDPAANTVHYVDGRTLPFDLFMGIPVHCAPEVVNASGLTTDGWIAVDPATFETKFPGVYAIGDVTSMPVPRVGVMAEGEARSLAEVLKHRLASGNEPDKFLGAVSCYVEFGGANVARFEANFLGGPSPVGTFTEPSAEMVESKKEFGATRRKRWFGLETAAAR